MLTLVFGSFPVLTAANTLDRVHGVAAMIAFAYGRIIRGASPGVTGAGNVIVAVMESCISEDFTVCRFERLAKHSDYTISYR